MGHYRLCALLILASLAALTGCMGKSNRAGDPTYEQTDEPTHQTTGIDKY